MEDGNPDHVTLGLRLQLAGLPPYCAWEDMYYLVLF